MKKFDFNKKMKLKFVFILVASVFLARFNVEIPFIAKNILDYSLDLNSTGIFNNSILLVFTILGLLVSETFRKLLTTGYKSDLYNSLRNFSTRGILNKSFEDFSGENNQEYISVYNNDIVEIVNDYYIEFIEIIFDFFSIVIYSISLFTLNPIMAVVVIFTNLLPPVIPMIFKRKLQDRKDDYLKSMKRYNVRLGDMIKGFLTIRINRIKNPVYNRMENSSESNMANLRKYENTRSFSEIIMGFFAYLNYFAIILIGAYLIYKNLLTAGGLLAAVAVSEILVIPVTKISYEINRFNSIKKIKNNFFRQFGVNDIEESKIKMNGEIEEIEIKNLKFSLNDFEILKGVTLKIEKNKKYLIYGSNGSGKSTILKILSKIYGDYSGNVLVNGTEIRDIDKNSFYEKVGIALQHPVMFNITLKENITLYNDYKDEKLKDVIKILKLDKIEEEIFSGETFADSKGNISGGEMQKINLARILLNKKNFVMLDEATSSCDSESSTMIEEYFLKDEGTTLFNIQHKMNKDLIDFYDSIIIVDKGKISNVFSEKKEKEDFKNGFL